MKWMLSNFIIYAIIYTDKLHSGKVTDHSINDIGNTGNLEKNILTSKKKNRKVDYMIARNVANAAVYR